MGGAAGGSEWLGCSQSLPQRKGLPGSPPGSGEVVGAQMEVVVVGSWLLVPAPGACLLADDKEGRGGEKAM